METKENTYKTVQSDNANKTKLVDEWMVKESILIKRL